MASKNSTKIREYQDRLNQEQERQRIAKSLSQLPPKYKDMDTDHLNLLEECAERSVFITGSVGVGKTVLMAAIAKQAVNAGAALKWVSYPELIMELQSAFRDDEAEPPETMVRRVARFSSLLAIDDLGVNHATPFVQEATYYIINHREQEMLPTLITSNFTLAGIDKMIDNRISSRICGMCKLVELGGDDRRQIQKRNENDNSSGKS